MEDDPDNLVLFMTDALRYDYHPELPGSTYKTITSGPNTPTAFPSLLSGTPQDEHGVEWFWGQPVQQPTVFDMEQEGYDVSYFEHPADRMRDILRHPPFKKLDELSEPFVFVERAVETHTPYDATWRDLNDPEDVNTRPEPGEAREYPSAYTGGEWTDGKEYINLMRQGEIDYLEDYKNSIEKAKERFNELVETLKDKGVYENTMVIWTADHGECFGGAPDDHDNCNNFIHNQPCEHVMHVGTTFYERDMDIDGPLIRQRDILGHWDERFKGGARGDLEIIEDREDNAAKQDDEEAVKDRLRDLGYL